MADESPVQAAKSDLGLRLVTAVFLLPLIWVIYQGGMAATALVFALGLIMSAEAIKVTGQPLSAPLSIIQVLMCLLPAAVLFWTDDPVLCLYMMASAVLVFWATCRLPLCLILAAVAALIAAVTGIISHPVGGQWLLLLIAVVMGADSAAYFIGRTVGGPKLAPVISPSKTWSGAIAGLVAGILVGYGAGMLLGLAPFSAALMGLVMADLSIGGDLMESWFKRRYKVKDSGHILPGHGGLLDRFDGYLLAAPFLYLVLAAGGIDG